MSADPSGGTYAAPTLGMDRLEEAFAGLRDRPVGKALGELMDLVRAHCGGRPVADDVTMVMVEREG